MQLLTDHPRFVQLFGIGCVPCAGDRQRPSRIMLCGGSLEGPKMHTEEEACGVMRSVLQGVAELHRGGAAPHGKTTTIIRHRDIKAGNVLLAPDGGAAAAGGPGEGSSERPFKPRRGPVMTGVAGTPLYMAPQIGSEKADNTYQDDGDAYSIIVLTMSLLELPAGSGVQRHSLSSWLGEVGLGTESQQLLLSRELRMFVRDGTSGATPEQLLSHPWVLGAKNEAAARKQQLQQRVSWAAGWSCLWLQLAGTASLHP
ncbi:hypothetical protein COO60DRAFT_1633334 [Scenedesmus sp. NREL 46B-D3]|nr:hypothetical protein COO60DRAFT_1633334 [Scenedesmus sp. NREL 46B-D3]